MKTTFLCLVLLFNFTSMSAGLKCYDCSDDAPNFQCDFNATVLHCHKSYEFCATYYYKNPNISGYGCGNNHYCIQKKCAWYGTECNDSGTFEVFDPVDNENFTVNCCKGDLCNRSSSAQYLYHNMLLFTLFVNMCVFIHFCN